MVEVLLGQGEGLTLGELEVVGGFVEGGRRGADLVGSCDLCVGSELAVAHLLGDLTHVAQRHHDPSPCDDQGDQ